jgi:VIT1/CCC1 family predicted Fe2+/Mn2+ transporter
VISPKECIEVDNVKYLVVDVEAGEVQTGLKMRGLSKRLAIKIFRQTVRGILEQMLWLDSKEVKQYLDIRNFIIVGETVYFMLVQRSRVRTTSLPRSEKRFSMPVSSSL